MAGDWLKFELETPDKPEVQYIAGVTKLDPDAVVGKLVRVWAWFDKHTTDGSALCVTQALIDRIANFPGFATAMIKAGWLAERGNTLTVPNFGTHNGKTAKNRAETNRRVAKSRLRNADVTQDAVTVSLPRPLVRQIKDRDGNACVYCSRKDGEYTIGTETPFDGRIHIDHVIPKSRGGHSEINNLVCACGPCNNFKNDRTPDECGLKWPVDETGKKRGCNGETVTKTVTREEKRREEKKEEKEGAHAPVDWIPDEAWADFMAHRKAKRAPMTAKAVELLVKKLAAYREQGVAAATVLNYAIEQGHTGLYYEKSRNGAGPVAPRPGYAADGLPLLRAGEL